MNVRGCAAYTVVEIQLGSSLALVLWMLCMAVNMVLGNTVPNLGQCKQL